MTGSTDAADSPERSPENAGSDAPGTNAAAAPAEASKPPKRKQGVLRKVVISVAIVVVLLVVVPYYLMLTFVARPYLVPSESMAPTLNVGGRFIVDKLTYRFSSPQPGDVIVFKAPPNWSVGYKSIRSHNTAVRWLQNALSVVGFVPPDENDSGQTDHRGGRADSRVPAEHRTHGGRQTAHRAVPGPGDDDGRSTGLPVPGQRVRPRHGATAGSG